MKRVFAVAALLILTGCPSAEERRTGSPSASSIQINGAGATFPYPLYSKWFDQYGKQHSNVRINYQSIGSGGGIKQLTAGTVFFGATDGPMTDEQLRSAPSPILHFPTVLGGVVPIYNVAGLSQQLHFTGPTLANIYLGRITRWNDPQIAKSNPGVTLPSADIVVVHRSDGSGTTYIWCDFLSKISPQFKQKVGLSTSVNWPAGVGAKGNEGVSGLVSQTPGAIGYVELIYASHTKIAYGAVQNKAGQFVAASLQSVTAAASSVTMPDDFRVSITNADGADAYPIASFTWLLLWQNPPDKERGRIMVDFLKWALTDGQKFAPDLGYAPLPQSLVQKEMQALQKIPL